jgi:hypothetical protein
MQGAQGSEEKALNHLFGFYDYIFNLRKENVFYNLQLYKQSPILCPPLTMKFGAHKRAC